MLTFKLFAICSLVLLLVWVVLGKTVRIPAFSFSGITAKIPAPRYASPARKDVWGLSAIHLVYLAIVISGILLLRQNFILSDWMTAAGIPPAEIGPSVENVLVCIAVAAGILLLLSLVFTVRRSAAWFTVACHSAFVMCMCRQICAWMESMSSLEEGQAMLTQYLFAYLGITAVYAMFFLLYAKMRKKPVPIA